MTTKAKFRFDASAIFLPGIGVLLLLLLWAITSSTLSKNLPSPAKTWEVSKPFVTAPFEKRGEAFFGFRRRAGAGHGAAFTFELDFQARLEALAQQFARAGERAGGGIGQHPGGGLAFLGQCLVRNGAGDQADALGLGRADPPVGQDHLLRPAQPDEAGEHPAHAAIRHQPDPAIGGGIVGGIRAEHDIAG